MNKKNTARIKVLLEKLKKTETNKPFTIVVLEYDSDEFFDKNYSISKWFQKFSNSKSATSRLTNREWFKNIDGGFYKYEVTTDTTKIIMAFTSIKPILELDLTVRINKIGPKPKELTIGIQDWELYNQYFTTLFDVRTGTETFGTLKTMDYYQVEIMQELIEPDNQLFNEPAYL
ncbi:hypothetical protein [Flavobacterium sp.]|uniref:hypothetical protein n=1 Tax=Flavobacterium sp. TaxID=239 RepID=UPI00286F7959|nr:hypothetical protein [Flavobacterium sp.]